MLKEAREVIAEGDTRKAVNYAIEVNREVASRKRELDKIKAFLREKAQEGSLAEDPDLWEDRDETIQVELEGDIGVAFIVFPSPEAKPRKGQSLKDIEANLPPATFARLFNKTITVSPVKSITDQLESLTEAERAVVDRFIEIVEPTGKVNLPR